MDYKIIPWQSLKSELDIVQFLDLPEEERQLAFDIFFEEIIDLKNYTDLVRLGQRTREQMSGYKTKAPALVENALVDKKIIDILKDKEIPGIPVKLNENEKKEMREGKIPPLAKQVYTNLIGNFFQSIKDSFSIVRRGYGRRISDIVSYYKKNISFQEMDKSFDLVSKYLIESIINRPEILSLLTISKELIGDYTSKEKDIRHSLDVTVTTLCLADELYKKKRGTDEYKILLETLSKACMLHDVGMLIYYKKIKTPVDAGDVVIDYLKEHDGFLKELVTQKKITDLREKLTDLVDTAYEKRTEKTIEPDEHTILSDKHPVNGVVLLTDSNGKPLPGLTYDILRIIYEHEFDIKGKLLHSGDPVMFDEDLEKEINVIHHELGIKGIPLNKNTQFIGGDNLEQKFGYETNKEEVEAGAKPTRIVRKELEIASQVLHVVERYFNLVGWFIKKKMKDPYHEASKQMYDDAKEDKINKYVFEVFLNKLMPSKYYPNNLTFEIATGGSHGYLREYAGHLATIVTSSQGVKCFVVFNKKLKRNMLGKVQLSKYIIKDAIKPLEEVAKMGGMYLNIFSWGAYYKNGLSKEIK